MPGPMNGGSVEQGVFMSPMIKSWARHGMPRRVEDRLVQKCSLSATQESTLGVSFQTN